MKGAVHAGKYFFDRQHQLYPCFSGGASVLLLALRYTTDTHLHELPCR